MLAGPLTTFGDLAHDGLAVEVTCPNCAHRRAIDGQSPRIRHRRIAGARFRCEECGSVGLPSLNKAGLNKAGLNNKTTRRWNERAADHARSRRSPA